MKRPIFVRPLSEAERETLEAGLRSADAFTMHRSRGTERQQIKWSVAAAVFGSSLLLPEGDNLGGLVSFLQNLLWIVVPASLPIVVGIDILRYRLYDIDILIDRVLVYGSFTGLLAGVYAGSIVLL